jgi:hypothetical protein
MICIQILTSRKLTTSVNDRSCKPQDSARSSTVEAVLLLRFCNEALGTAANSPPPPAPTSQPLHRLRPVSLPLMTGKTKRKRWSAFHVPITRIPRPNYPNSMSRSSLRTGYNVFSSKCTNPCIQRNHLIGQIPNLKSTIKNNHEHLTPPPPKCHW